MALAPKTVLTYPLDGSNRDFTIPFEYLARKFVQVTLIGTDRKLLTLNIDYRFTLRTIITLTKNWGPADGYERIEIRRYTSATERLVDFSDGSILRAYDLNTSQVQSLHIAEEGRDVASDTIGVNNDGDLDARGRKIVNLADAVSDGDAVTLRQEKAWGASTLSQANRSKTEADRSEAHQKTATTEANRARTEADRSADRSASSGASATRSQDSATASEVSRKASTVAEGASKTAANESKNWATQMTGPVAGGLYSAQWWANESAKSATASQTSTNTSKSHADRSATEANRSRTEADRAESEADKIGSFNGLAGALEGVNGVDVTWKGVQATKGRYQVCNNGEASYSFANLDGSNSVRWTRNAQGEVRLVDDTRGQIRFQSDTVGNVTVSGSVTADWGLYAKGGSVSSRARGADNAYFWLDGPTGTRAVVFAGADKVLTFRAGDGPSNMRLTADGTLSGLNTVQIGGIRMDSSGNIVSPAYKGGTLAAHLSSYDTGFFAVTGSRQYDFTHGLFQAPLRFAIQIKCVDPENGYAPGDIIHCPVGLDFAGGGLAFGFDVRNYNATTFNLYVGQSLRAYAINKQNTAVAGPSPANWHVRVIAYAV